MIKNLSEARRVQAMIDKLGVKDVVLMYDKEIHMWSVNQVFRKPSVILTMDPKNMHGLGATIMFWIKNNDGTYRVPSDQDVNDVIAIVTRAQTWFDKGSDAMLDEVEKAEKETYDKNRQKQSERILSFAKPLKKAIKKELG